MHQKRIRPGLITLAALTGLIGLWGFLTASGIADGTFFPVDGTVVGWQLLAGAAGLLSGMLLTVPLWAVYGYFRVAGSFRRAGKKRAFLLWIILVPVLTAALIAAAVYFYILLHQVVY